MPDVVTSRKQQEVVGKGSSGIKQEPGSSGGPEEGASASQPIDAEPMVVDGPGIEIPVEKSTVLKGHESEVFICAWNPMKDLLASGSGDSTARIWTMNTTPDTGDTAVKVLKHCIQHEGREVPSNKD